MTHLAYAPVVLRPDNLDGTSRVFDVIVGIPSADVAATVRTWPTELDPGTVVGAFEIVPEAPFWRGTLYAVNDNGGPLNELDEQPQVGDEVFFTVSPYTNMFASGMTMRVVEGGWWVHPAASIVLTLYPILAAELWSALRADHERLVLIENALRDLSISLSQSPLTPEQDPPTAEDLPIGTPAGEPVPEDLPPAPTPPEIPSWTEPPATAPDAPEDTAPAVEDTPDAGTEDTPAADPTPAVEAPVIDAGPEEGNDNASDPFVLDIPPSSGTAPAPDPEATPEATPEVELDATPGDGTGELAVDPASEIPGTVEATEDPAPASWPASDEPDTSSADTSSADLPPGDGPAVTPGE